MKLDSATLYIALLRAINVAGHQPVPMTALRQFLTDLGFVDARSLLQSGNLIFRTKASTGTQMERLLEAKSAKRLALQTDFFVRTAAEWKTLIANNPFHKEAERDPAHLVVMFLKDAPDMSQLKALQATITGPEVVRAAANQAYIIYPDGIGRSRLTNALIEKKLATRGTGRNWNTVMKLAALIGA